MVESAGLRQKLRAVAEVPLADHPGAITCRLEQFADVALGRRHAAAQVLGLSLHGGKAAVLVAHRAALGKGTRGHLLLEAKALLVATGHQTGTRGAAQRCAAVAVGEAHTIAPNAVDTRCLDQAVAIGRQVAVAHVIGQDDHHIGAAPRRIRVGHGCRLSECGK
jgi:hypothetical protein